jgi:hypothetical protein
MRTEITVIAISIAAIIGVFLHLPVHSILIISLSLLSMVYFAGAFLFFSVGKPKENQIVLSVICGLLFSITPIALLFKIQIWSPNESIVTGAMIACFIALIVVLSVRSRFMKNDRKFIKRLLFRSIVLLAISSALLLISTPTLLKLIHWNNPEIARIRSLHYEYPDNEEYRLRNDSLFFTGEKRVP